MELYKLPEMEQRFADIVWENQPIGSRALTEICADLLNWKRTTTYTVLKKLCGRGIFENKKGTVVALIAREDFIAKYSEQLINENYSGSLPQFLAAFTRIKKLSSAEIDELQKLIDQHREG